MNNHENSRFDYMAAELDTLKNDMAEVKAIVKDMHNLLAGNPIDKDSNGLISDFKQIKREVYAIKAELKKYKSYFYALVTLISLGVIKIVIEFLKAQ
jgi:hypothetical protein